MARLTTAILCDFAQIREGLLYVLAGGITRLNRPGLPAPAAVRLALVLELQPNEFDIAHEIKVTVVHNETMATVGTATVGTQVGGAVTGLQPGEPLQLPVVIPFEVMQLDHVGAYDIRITVDAQAPEFLTFYVVDQSQGMGSETTPDGP